MQSEASPTGRFRFSRLPEAIDALESTIADLEKASVRVPESGRLRMHVATLRAAMALGAYDSEPVARRRVANALRDAAEFSYVTSVLPANQSRQIAVELQRAMGGTTDQQEATGEPYQFQSQYFFAALLAQSGIDLRVAENQEALPDFLVPNGTRVHGIEIKRPGSLKRLREAVGKARTQLGRVSGGGMIVVDASDIIAADLTDAVEAPAGPDTWHDRFAPPFRDVLVHIHDQICKPGRTAPRPRYSAVINYSVFARGWVWNVDADSGESWPEFRSMFYSRRVYRARNLAFHRGTWLRDSLERGLRDALGPVTLIRED